MTAAAVAAPAIKKSPLRMLAAVCILAIGVCILAFAMSGTEAANHDYICYWAAGQQLAHGANPYDGDTILRLEKAYGYSGNRPFLMRNPPHAFFLALPLGLFQERTGAILWAIAIVAALMTSIRLLWILHGRSSDRTHFLLYVFPPALACLLVGQTGIFVLLGITLFLYLQESCPYLAGASLLLCAIKPHLLLPFGIALLAWIFTRKAYQVLAGASIALAGSVAISSLFDPHGWSHYAAMAQQSKVASEFIPTLSAIVRIAADRAIGRNAAWPQLLLPLAGCTWALWYFRRHRSQWDWLRYSPWLLLVSILVAPYAWLSDQAVVLPAILAGLYATVRGGRSLIPFACIMAPALIEVMIPISPHSPLYLWTTPAWLAWYLYAARTKAAGEAASVQTPFATTAA